MFERVALLDVSLEIADVAAALGLQARPAGKAHLGQGLAHAARAAAVAGGVDVGLADLAHIGAAAEEAAEMALFVAPGGDFHRSRDRRIGIEHACGLERVDHPQRTIEPAGMVLALQMRSRQQLRAGLGAGAEHIADAVDGGRELRVGQPLGQPAQGLTVRFGEGRTVDAGLVASERAQRVEIGEDAGAIGAAELGGHQAETSIMLRLASSCRRRLQAKSPPATASRRP